MEIQHLVIIRPALLNACKYLPDLFIQLFFLSLRFLSGLIICDLHRCHISISVNADSILWTHIVDIRTSRSKHGDKRTDIVLAYNSLSQLHRAFKFAQPFVKLWKHTFFVSTKKIGDILCRVRYLKCRKTLVSAVKPCFSMSFRTGFNIRMSVHKSIFWTVFIFLSRSA